MKKIIILFMCSVILIFLLDLSTVESSTLSINDTPISTKIMHTITVTNTCDVFILSPTPTYTNVYTDFSQISKNKKVYIIFEIKNLYELPEYYKHVLIEKSCLKCAYLRKGSNYLFICENSLEARNFYEYIRNVGYAYGIWHGSLVSQEVITEYKYDYETAKIDDREVSLLEPLKAEENTFTRKIVVVQEVLVVKSTPTATKGIIKVIPDATK
jgi:hypothetical protein